jgi:hypothetical protein
MIPFVGRERECRRLFDAWERARAGEAQHLLVRGEAGIGKTRLVDELVAHARAGGGRVLRGRAWDVGGAPAYWPWSQALGSHLDEVGADAVAPLLLDVDPSVVRLVPRLRGSLRAPADYDEGGSEAAQLRLFDGVVLLLRRLGADRPVLLVLDDLEAADAQTLQLLRFLVRARTGGPLMVVAVHRTPVPPAAPGAAALWGIAREPGVDVLGLGGLSAGEIGALLAAMTGAPGPNVQAEVLHARTGGNPLFASEFIRLQSASEPAPDAAPPPGQHLPSGVRGVIGQRLGGLPRRCQELLAMGAVIGREVELGTLALVAGETPEALLAALAPALDGGVLDADPERPMFYRFSHPLVRESLYEELAPAVRADLHRRVGDSLRARFAAAIDEHLDTIANHYVAAVAVGAAPLALEYCRRAARRASGLAARDEAVRLLELALEAVPAVDDPQLGCELLLELGEAQARAGRADDARGTLLRVAERAERLGLPTVLARAALGFGGRFVWSRPARGSPEVGLLTRALSLLPAAELPLRARLLARLTGLSRDRTSAAENAARCREAVALARQADGPEARQALTQVLSALAVNEFAVGTPGGLIAVADQLLAVARAAGDVEQEMQGHDYRTMAFVDLGDTLSAEDELASCVGLAERLAQPDQRWFSSVARAQLALVRGQLALAEQLGWEARQLGEAAQRSESRFCYLLQLYFIRREQGRLAELAASVDEEAARLPSWALLRCLRVHLRAQLGPWQEVEAFLERQTASGYADIQDSLHYRFMLALCAEMVSRTGHRAGAAALAPLLEAVPHRHLVTPASASAGSALRYRGLVAATLGQHHDAARWLRQAAQDNRAAGSPIWALRCDLDLARVLREAGPALAGARAGQHDADASAAAEAARLAAEVRREAAARGLDGLAAEAGALAGGEAGDGAGVAAAARGIRAPDGAATAAAAPEFRREGETWTVGWGGRSLRLRDVKGLRYLGQLLAQPGKERAALDMAAGARVPVAATPHARLLAGDLGPVLDATARAQFQRRLADLDGELEEAERWNDGQRLGRIRQERDALAQELAASVGLGGRDRRMGDISERARQSVTKAIKAAIRRIATDHAELGRHLDATVHTGFFCRYQPDPLHPPDWQVEL